MLDETSSAPRRRFGKWNLRVRNSFSSQTGCKQGSPDVWLSPRHCLAMAWTTILTAWQSVPPTDSLGCHLPPLGRSSTTSFPSKNSKKGVLKYQQASRDHGKQLLNLLLLPEHISFLEGEGPSTQQGESYPFSHSPSLSTDNAETATRTPGR